MRLGFLVNAIEDVSASQATAALMHRAAQLGFEAWAFGVEALSWSARDEVVASARRVEPGQDIASTLERLGSASRQAIVFGPGDALMIRTNPARDTERALAHEASLGFAQLIEQGGALVLNRPEGLMRSTTKLYLQRLPAAARPVALLSADRAELERFVLERQALCVLKPLRGTRGDNVMLTGAPALKAPEGITAPRPLDEVLDRLTGQGPIIAQLYLKEAVEGDVRVIAMEGRALTLDGQVAAVRRRPKGGEFRSNIHIGGVAEPGVVTEAMHETIELIGPILRRDGIFLAGLDFIGSKLVEVNTFSTGGMPDAERFFGVDFTAAILERVGALVAAEAS